MEWLARRVRPTGTGADRRPIVELRQKYFRDNADGIIHGGGHGRPELGRLGLDAEEENVGPRHRPQVPHEN